ncbi:hypothetical protein ACQPXH_20460 [Nocardia sp. CA-135953]|uniref:hypothetical protein n=1 Tax=Nocardia sp. CA-135953 TaxID=3239978 RepID=UPI003D96B593
MVIGQFQAQPSIEFQLVVGIGFVKYLDQPAEGIDELFDSFRAQALMSGGFECGLLGGNDFSFLLDLSCPPRDQCWVGSRFERGAMAGEFPVEGGQRRVCPVFTVPAIRLGSRIERSRNTG